MLNWHDAKNVTIVNITNPSLQHYGMSFISCQKKSRLHLSGQAQANVFEGRLIDKTPLLFTEKQVLAVKINDAFVLAGDRAYLPHSMCEVYAVRELVTNVGCAYT